MGYKFLGKEYESLEEISFETFLTVQGLKQIFFNKTEVNQISTQSKIFIKDGCTFEIRKEAPFWDVVKEVRIFDFNKWGKVYGKEASSEERMMARRLLCQGKYRENRHPYFKFYIKRNLIETMRKEVAMTIKKENLERFHYSPEVNGMISDTVSGYRVFQCLDLTWKCVTESDSVSIRDMMIKGCGSKSLSAEIKKCKRISRKEINGVVLDTPFHTLSQGAKILGVTKRAFREIVRRAGTSFLTKEVLLNEKRVKAIVGDKIYLTVHRLWEDVSIGCMGHFEEKFARIGKKYFESFYEIQKLFEIKGKRYTFRGKRYNSAELYKEIGYWNDWIRGAFSKDGNLDKVSPAFKFVKSSLGENLRVRRDCTLTAEEAILEGKKLDTKKWVTLGELSGSMGKRNQRSLYYRLKMTLYGKSITHPIFNNVFLRKEAEETKFLYERDFSEEEYVPMSYVMTKYEEEIRDFFGAEKSSKYGVPLCWNIIRLISNRFFKSDFEAIKEMKLDKYHNKVIAFYKKDELCQIVEKILSLGYKYFQRMKRSDILSFSIGASKKYQRLAEGVSIYED